MLGRDSRTTGRRRRQSQWHSKRRAFVIATQSRRVCARTHQRARPKTSLGISPIFCSTTWAVQRGIAMRSHAGKPIHFARPEPFDRRELCTNLPRQQAFCTTSQNGHPSTRPLPLDASDSRPTTSGDHGQCTRFAPLKSVVHSQLVQNPAPRKKLPPVQNWCKTGAKRLPEPGSPAQRGQRHGDHRATRITKTRKDATL